MCNDGVPVSYTSLLASCQHTFPAPGKSIIGPDSRSNTYFLDTTGNSTSFEICGLCNNFEIPISAHIIDCLIEIYHVVEQDTYVADSTVSYIRHAIYFLE